jgi:hypothetical protein
VSLDDPSAVPTPSDPPILEFWPKPSPQGGLGRKKCELWFKNLSKYVFRVSVGKIYQNHGKKNFTTCDHVSSPDPYGPNPSPVPRGVWGRKKCELWLKNLSKYVFRVFLAKIYQNYGKNFFITCDPHGPPWDPPVEPGRCWVRGLSGRSGGPECSERRDLGPNDHSHRFPHENPTPGWFRWSPERHVKKSRFFADF